MFMDEVNPEQIISAFLNFGYKSQGKIIDRQTGKLLHVSFVALEKLTIPGPTIDIFFWVKSGNNYYHTYDAEMRHPKDGYLERYVFKGTPCEFMDDTCTKLFWPETHYEINYNLSSGSLLDHWYPGWIVPDKNFGQSTSDAIVVVSGIPQLLKPEIIAPQIESSKMAYRALKSKICGR